MVCLHSSPILVKDTRFPLFSSDWRCNGAVLFEGRSDLKIFENLSELKVGVVESVEGIINSILSNRNLKNQETIFFLKS